MSRARLRKALGARSQSDPAIVLLVESHAARLEQLPAERWLRSAEAQAKMLRGAQGLYGVDAVTIGGGVWLAAEACRLAAAPGLGAAGARAAAQAPTPLAALPDPEVVAATPAAALACDVVKRLRPVLADRAGIALVLPDPARLARQLGRPDQVGWAADALAALLRTIGPEEPDLILLCGDDDPIDATLEGLAEFYGTPLLSVGLSSPPGLVPLSTDQLLSETPPAPAWLYTTLEEIPADTDPQTLRAAIDRLRRPAW